MSVGYESQSPDTRTCLQSAALREKVAVISASPWGLGICHWVVEGIRAVCQIVGAERLGKTCNTGFLF